jgi:DNA-binding NarL/FixJ family response regulator
MPMKRPEAHDERVPAREATARPERKLVVVSEYPLLRTSVKDAVAGSEFAVVGEAKAERRALELLAANPDAALILATRDPRRVLDLVRERFPQVPVVVFDDSATPATARAALAYGARGFLASTIEPDELVPALRQILSGASFRVVGIGLAEVGLEAGDLTQRERQMLAAVAEGLSNGTIAARFAVAEPTVKLHLTRIYRKLGVRNRTEAARWVFEHRAEAGSAKPS